ncbi:putative uncharacterized protein DDB_G0287265 isoform X1 [Centruroides sculpturatus]|nr:putative uncharacterized protein DDB_G0287265 isoform X1 [Centruroides sculpturatus]XP_023226312.1 putative uncharacterized protein DDB_G0287265 isoform X1 [Centruroides sculpturatus]
MANERAMYQTRNISSTIGQLLQDIHLEAAPPKPKPKPKPKDYAKENFKKLKEIQEKCKQKEEEKLKLLQKKMGPNKYKNVKSKVFSVSGRPNSNIESEKLNDESNSVATCDSSLSILPPSVNQCGDENSNKSPSPKPDLDENQLNEIRGNCDNDLIHFEDDNSTSSLKERNPDDSNENPSDIDFSKESNQTETHADVPTHQHFSAMSHKKNENNDNISSKSVVFNCGSAKSNASDAKSIKSTKGKEMKIHQLGEVPKYLIQRQYEQKEEELKRKKEEVDPSIPLGHIVLSEEERISTLEKFKKNKEELLREYIHLPVCCDTLRAKKKKELLEKELTKMDEGIEIFSKHRVLIKVDE